MIALLFGLYGTNEEINRRILNALANGTLSAEQLARNSGIPVSAVEMAVDKTAAYINDPELGERAKRGMQGKP